MLKTYSMKRLSTLLLILISFTGFVYGQKTSNTIELNSHWEYTHFPYCQTDEQALSESESADWKSAVVPGDVHLDLQRNGELPDLVFGQNFYRSVWVENDDFMYRTSFDAPSQKKNSSIYLDFDGLDCFATIWLNGKQIAKTHNMFMRYSYDVSSSIKAENNSLLIRLASPMKEIYNYYPNAVEVLKDLGGAFGVKERLITRKAQMNYGWDNTPRIITTGIFRPVSLRVCETARIDNVWFKSRLENNYQNATADVVVETLSNGKENSDIEVVLSKGNKKYSASKKLNSIAANKIITTTFSLDIPDPELWWPSNLGKQPLYTLRVNIIKEGKITDTYFEKVAIREIKVVNTPVEKRMVNYRIGKVKAGDPDPLDGISVGAWSKIPLDEPEEVEVTPFKFYVNGRYVFMKGFDWQPLDLFPVTVSKEKYDRSVEAVVQTGSNMLRVWGGANVENPEFYDACDEKGILVWQDFFYASGQFPNDDFFLKEAEIETINIVKHLRNRACLAAWCGDNESDMVTYDRGFGQFANKISHVVQKKVLAECDPDRYWHPSSPSGGGYPRSSWGGDKRNWGAKFPEDDYQHIRGDESRFISEGGVGAFPQLSTFRKFMPREFEWPVNSDFYFMHWGDLPTARYHLYNSVLQNMDTYFGSPENPAEIVYFSQILQAHGLSRMAQNFRKNMEQCGGILIWKWAEVWPSVCFSVFEHAEHKKAAFYSVKRAYAPCALTMDNVEEKLSVWYLNDLDGKENQQVRCQLLKCDGTNVQEWSKTIDFEENNSAKVIDIDVNREDFRNGDYYFKMWVENNSSIPAYHYIPCYFKELKTKPHDLDLTVMRNSASSVTLSFKASEFTPYVLVTGNDPTIHFSDNAFFMDKGEVREIELTVPKGELCGDFSLRYWNNKDAQTFTIESELLKPVGMTQTIYP
jgi:beta-mannosidase